MSPYSDREQMLTQIFSDFQRLNPGVHFFCLRNEEDDTARYDDAATREAIRTDPDAPEKLEKKKLAGKARCEKFLKALQLVAYQGDDVAEYQRFLWSSLDRNLGRCDVCIRQYYVGKLGLKDQLSQEYEDSDIKLFFDLIDRNDIDRISRGLKRASERLESLPETRRTLKSLETQDVHALFEALSCKAFLLRDDLLRSPFDAAFKLIQTRKPLKTRDYLPAATAFLFDQDDARHLWATYIWSDYPQPTEEDWTWACKDVLQQQIMDANHPAAMTRLWRGLSHIVARLEKEAITLYLADLIPGVFNTSLNHLNRRTNGLRSILQIYKTITDRAPKPFWDAMGPISASTVIEQIFSSPLFDTYLADESITTCEPRGSAGDMLDWIGSFMTSLPAANRPPACRTTVGQLFKRVQNDTLTDGVRFICCRTAYSTMVGTLKAFNENDQTSKSVGHVAMMDALEIVTDHIQLVLTTPSFTRSTDQNAVLRKLSVDIAKNSLALECKCLRADFMTLYTVERPKAGQAPKENKLDHGGSAYSPLLWNAVVGRLRNDDMEFSQGVIRGVIDLPGLQRFQSSPGRQLTEVKARFNTVFDKMTAQLGRVLEKIGDFEPNHLDALYTNQDTNIPLGAALLSADDTIYDAAVTLIKNISGESVRRDALGHLLRPFLASTLTSFSWVFRRLADMRTYSSVPRALRTSMEALEVLCNTEDGILRTMTPTDKELHAVWSFWQYSWRLLRTIFLAMEMWHEQGYEKAQLMEVCRDAMQFADQLFEQFPLFRSVLGASDTRIEYKSAETLLKYESGSPAAALETMTRWFRLRDEYLAQTLVKLFARILSRLGDLNVEVPVSSLVTAETVAITSEIKTILTGTEKAEIVRALEKYHGRPIKVMQPFAVKKPSQANISIYLDGRRGEKTASETPTSKADSVDEFGDSGISDNDIYQLSATTLRFQAQQQDKARQALQAQKAIPSRSVVKPPEKTKDVNTAFIDERKRQKEQADAKKRELAAKARGESGIGSVTGAAGSGLKGIGVAGKVHKTPDDSLMVSSDSSSEDSEDETDRQLFGSKVQKLRKPGDNLVSDRANQLQKQKGPVKKIKAVRTKRDMRARLQPDLSSLHKTILGWDFFCDDEVPPSLNKSDYTLVTNTFETVRDYQKTFEPLLILEGWQSFRSEREEGTFKPFEFKVSNRLNVDDFIEATISIPAGDSKELGIITNDILLLSKGENPHTASKEPHCLARVKDIKRKRGNLDFVLIMNSANNKLSSNVGQGSSLYGVRVMSLTTLEREYSALMALPYYDLWEEIVKAKPSPLLEYPDSEIQPIVRTYDVNPAQARAVRSAIDNDAFTLIQGPPGSGKTKTISALVGAMLTNPNAIKDPAIVRLSGGTKNSTSVLAGKKMLICAPSNAAVDELVMRFKTGIKLLDGSTQKLNVVRLGKSDRINENIKDVTLEELVMKRLNAAAPKDPKKDRHAVMMEHKDTSKQIHELREEMNTAKAAGKQVVPAQEQLFDSLKKNQNQLSSEIDKLRDEESVAQRDADLSRKRMQQAILDEANVLCATLSGSGHEIFQNLQIEFETVIIDEAAQSIELSALIPLKYGCSKCVLVGDPKQLPPTVLSKEAARFQYEQSLFARMEKNHKKDIHLLDTQYRMHPEISSYPSKTFYDGKLKDGPDMAKLRKRPWHNSPIFAPYRFFDVRGMQEAGAKGRSLINYAELNVAMAIYDRLTADCRSYDFNGKIGIITPYKAQLKELKLRFCQAYGDGITARIEFNTTDAFQGRECEIIIFSCVRASTKGIGFLNDVRRMNVGLTRAKCSLWVLGSSEALVQGQFWRGLVNDAKSRSVYTEGDIPKLFSRTLLTDADLREDVEMSGMSPMLPPQVASRRPSVASAVDLTDSGPASPARDGNAPTSRRSSAVSMSSSASSAPRPQPARHTPSRRNTDATSSSISDSSNATPPTKVIIPRKHPLARKDSNEWRPPAPERPALNSKTICGFCGSSEHFANNCDNQEAVSATFGDCERCGVPGHYKVRCYTPRCIDCGEFGHLKDGCRLPPDQRPPLREQQMFKREVDNSARFVAKCKAQRLARQEAERNPQIPKVWSLAELEQREAARKNAATGPNTHRNRPGIDGSADAKRKRSGTDEGSKFSKAVKLPGQGANNGLSTNTNTTSNGLPPRPPPGLPNKGPGGPRPPQRKAGNNDNAMFINKK